MLQEEETACVSTVTKKQPTVTKVSHGLVGMRARMYLLAGKVSRVYPTSPHPEGHFSHDNDCSGFSSLTSLISIVRPRDQGLIWRPARPSRGVTLHLFVFV